MQHRPNYDAETLAPRARALPGDATLAENALWRVRRGGDLGARFRRHQSVGPFIVDFDCAAVAPVVERNGAGHADPVAYDARRTAWLGERDLTVLRLANADVLTRPQDVYVTNMTALPALTPALRATPCLRRERGRKDTI